MEQLQRAGKARLLGASNISRDQLAALCDGADITPAFVQNRCYARTLWDREVRHYCAAHDIVYQGFSLLTANARELRHGAIAAIQQRLGCTIAQIVFRFAMQVGMLPLTGTSDADHMAEDLACTDYELTDAEIAAVEAVAS